MHNPYVKKDLEKANMYEEEVSRINQELLSAFKRDMYFLKLPAEKRFEYEVYLLSCHGSSLYDYLPPELIIYVDVRDLNQTLFKYFGNSPSITEACTLEECVEIISKKYNQYYKFRKHICDKYSIKITSPMTYRYPPFANVRANICKTW